MTKRLLAIITSVLMMITILCAVPVSATELPENIATDYVAGTITGNMITTGSNGIVGNAWSGDYTYGYNGRGPLVIGVASGDKVYFKPTADIGNILDSKTNSVAGYIVKTTKPAGQSGRVVWSFSFKADQVGKELFVNVGRRNEGVAAGSDAYIEYPIEYNGVDKGIVPTTGYVAYTGSFADKGVASDKYTYEIGFVKGTVAQAMARIDTSKSYIGYEYAHDIAVTADSTYLEPGASATVSAEILNQIGSKGGLLQDVTWYALNEERTAIVPGINIYDNADGSVTVTSSNSVETGTYSIVAVSDAYPQFVKGIEIEVENIDYSDYVPGEVTGNLFGDELSLSFNYLHRTKLEGETGQVDDVLLSSGADYYTIRALRDMDDPSVQYSDPDGDGFTTWDGTSRYYHTPYAGGFATVSGIPENSTANLVFDIKVKNGNSAYTPVVGFGRYNNAIASTANPERVNYPVGCANGSEGFSVTDSEWQSFTGTFAVQPGYVLNSYAGYAVGLAGGNVKGAEVHVSKTESYLGVEYIHDLTLNADGTELATTDDVINLDYAIVNQIGTKGAIPQTVEFLVMSPDRQTIIEDSGITVTDNGDGTAKVTVDPFTAIAGDYDIVAYNAANRMAKGVRVTVKESDVISTLSVSEFSGSSVTATAKLLNKTQTPINAVMVIIMVDDDNEIQDIATQSISGITNADNIKTYTKTLTATDLTKVTKAKAFLLDCGNSASAMLADTTLGELALSQTVIK